MVVSTVAVLQFLCPIRDVRAEPEILKPEKVRQMIDQTKRNFRIARFNKPADANNESIEHKFAPLIVEETDLVPTSKIGAFSNPYINDETAPLRPDTVYFHVGTISDGNKELDYIAFLWWYEKPIGCVPMPLSATLQTRGVRIVLGPDGMPLLWEALTEGSLRVFFVPESLEAAAKAQFGDPLPGRNFSIERDVEVCPNVVAVRQLNDGPVPIGPYVYIDATPARAVTTILCRCMDSQFDEVVEPAIEYRLESLESLDTKWLRESAGVEFDKLLKPEPLDRFFRWPKM